MPAALLDVDGTLVDTNHRQVGMGGDQLVPAPVPGINPKLDEAIEQTRSERYAELLNEVQRSTRRTS